MRKIEEKVKQLVRNSDTLADKFCTNWRRFYLEKHELSNSILKIKSMDGLLTLKKTEKSLHNLCKIFTLHIYKNY